MKKTILQLTIYPITVLMLTVNLILPNISLAQFTKLYDIGGSGTPIIVSNVLYGLSGGTGSIFKINKDGTGISSLHDFQGIVHMDGETPYGSLVYDGTTLYGMTYSGGAYDPGPPAAYNNYGTIFEIKPNGTYYLDDWNFYYNNGINPYGSLIIVGGDKIGMTSQGGVNGKGTIYSTSGSVLHAFSGGISDGSYPHGDLVSDGTYLYGMTPSGGTNGYGTIFKININGTGYTILYNFDGINGSSPSGSLIFIGSTLYGMTGSGGTNGYGVIFKISTSGTYSKLYNFNGTNGNSPSGNLIYDKTFLFGMTKYGGANGVGTLFKIDLSGSNYIDLVDFGGTKGDNPTGSLTSDGTYLYGMTPPGGTNITGTIFKYNYCSTAPLTITNSSDYDFGHSNIYPTITFNPGIAPTTSQVFKYANTSTLNGPFTSGAGKTISITPVPCP